MASSFRWSAVLLVIASATGCASLTAIPDRYYDVRRAPAEQILVVRPDFLPQLESNFQLRGKGQGAAAGAGGALAYCAAESISSGPLAPLVFILVCPPATVVGAVIGAVGAERRERVTSAEARLDLLLEQLQTQERLARQVADYLTQSGLRAELADPAITRGPAGPEEMPVYSARAFAGYSTVFEIALLEIRFDSPGTKGLSACLSLAARARRIATGANAERVFDYPQRGGCRTTEEWLANGGAEFQRVLDQAFRILAEVLVDESFLLYYPGSNAVAAPRADEAKTLPERLVPDFALRPVAPELREPTLNLAAAFSSRRGVRQGVGGMQFTDIDTLEPAFQWEVFPRAQDVAHADGDRAAFSDVTYDLRVFDGVAAPGGVVWPKSVAYERTGLAATTHRIEQKLRACEWYFWTVRARFRLYGVPRVTEWSGIYHTVGGRAYPPAYRDDPYSAMFAGFNPTQLYFPLRTPASSEDPHCWE